MNPQSVLRSQYLPQAAEKYSKGRFGRVAEAAQDVNRLASSYQSAGSPGKFFSREGEFRTKMLPGLAEKYGGVPVVGKALGLAQKASGLAKRFGFGANIPGVGRGKKVKVPRNYGPRALSRHHAMRMFAAAGPSVGEISRLAAQAVRNAEKSGMAIQHEVQRIMMDHAAVNHGLKKQKRAGGGGVSAH